MPFFSHRKNTEFDNRSCICSLLRHLGVLIPLWICSCLPLLTEHSCDLVIASTQTAMCFLKDIPGLVFESCTILGCSTLFCNADMESNMTSHHCAGSSVGAGMDGDAGLSDPHLRAAAVVVLVSKGKTPKGPFAAKRGHSCHHLFLYLCSHPELPCSIVAHHLQRQHRL